MCLYQISWQFIQLLLICFTCDVKNVVKKKSRDYQSSKNLLCGNLECLNQIIAVHPLVVKTFQ